MVEHFIGNEEVGGPIPLNSLREYRDNRNSKAITVAINLIYAHAFSRVRRLFEYLNQVYALSRTHTVKLSKIT